MKKKQIANDEENNYWLEPSEDEILEGEVIDSEASSLVSIAQEKFASVWEKIKQASPYVASVLSNIPQKGEKILAVNEATLKRMVERGEHFYINKNGTIDGVTRIMKNGHERFDLAVELERKEMPGVPANPAQALATAALAQQIAAVTALIENVKGIVSDILEGQWCDRLAKIESAKELIFLAQNMKDEEKKQFFINKAISESIEGEKEIKLSLEKELMKFETLKSSLFSKNKSKKEIQKNSEQIESHICDYLDSIQTKCYAIYESGELEALSAEAKRSACEINKLLSQERLLKLNSRVSVKGDKNFWSITFRNKKNKVCNVLVTMEKQADFLLNFENKEIVNA